MIEPEHDAPDLEDLAAYIDGRLSAERRARVEERLLHDEDYYDVFVDSAQFLQQHGQEEDGRSTEGGEVVAPAVWRQSWKVIMPLAVAATLVAAVILPRMMLGPSTGESVAQLNAVEIVDMEGWDDPGWARLRSGNITQGLYRPEELAFRIGLRTVDLRVALAAENRIAASRLTHLLGELAHEADLIVESAAYRDLLSQIEDAELDTLAKHAADIEGLLTGSFELEPPEARRFVLGAWTEAGRLAALIDNAEVLADIVRRQQVAQGANEIAPQLKELKAAIEQPEPDFEAAGTAFREIARALAGRG